MKGERLAPTRVLLVEDESLIRLILSESLVDEGLLVAEAANGGAALALIDGTDRFQVLLTDMQMPGHVNGAEVARRARQRDPEIVVIYMTGRPEVLRDVGSLGARDAFLRKPFAPSELLATIQRLLAADP